MVAPKGEEDKPRQVLVGPNQNSAVVDVLKPASDNMITVLPYNGQYDGPASTSVR